MEVIKQEGRTCLQGSCMVCPSDRYAITLFEEDASIRLADAEEGLMLAVDLSTEDAINLAKTILKHYEEEK